ncbi:MAG: hypothetical protein H6530_02115 [Nocardioidaceae bacterium]|nr:hypothetical protein [Nocardioidaceae bacterium]
MTISGADSFILVPGPWDAQGTASDEAVHTDWLQTLIERPEVGRSDLDVVVTLMDLVRDDLQLSGTAGGVSSQQHDHRVPCCAVGAVGSLGVRDTRAAAAAKVSLRQQAVRRLRDCSCVAEVRVTLNEQAAAMLPPAWPSAPRLRGADVRHGH